MVELYAKPTKGNFQARNRSIRKSTESAIQMLESLPEAAPDRDALLFCYDLILDQLGKAEEMINSRGARS